MDWSIDPTLASLAGVALGSMGTLVGQYLSTRASARQAATERAQALRAERKDAILRFLAVAQEAESIAERWQNHGEREQTEALAVTHRVWQAQKELKIVCSQQLREPAFLFTRSLRDVIWQDPPELQASLWAWLREPRDIFMNAARSEMGADQAEKG
jgi:hypothetical protein